MYNDQAVYNLVMNAYDEEMIKWKKKTNKLEDKMRRKEDEISELEMAKYDEGALAQLKSKISGKGINAKIRRLEKELGRLELEMEKLEREKPNEVAYELGGISNTLFYKRSAT